MGKVTDLNIKNKAYYFFNDMINIEGFQSNVLTIDKKPHKDFDIIMLATLRSKKLVIVIIYAA